MNKREKSRKPQIRHMLSADPRDPDGGRVNGNGQARPQEPGVSSTADLEKRIRARQTIRREEQSGLPEIRSGVSIMATPAASRGSFICAENAGR